MEARYIRSCSEEDKKAYQYARNIYLLKLKTAKCLYLNTTVENTQGDQRKLFGLLDFLTKEPKGNHKVVMYHWLMALHAFCDKIETICESFTLED